MSVLGEMTSGFAHELNQPLSAIRHYAQGCLIRLRVADEQHPLLPALEQIDQQAQRGADTLRNLRHWVSQAQGNPVLTEEWKVIAIREAIDHVWQLLRMAQQFPSVTLHTEVSAALRVTLPSVLLEQVLANIILNALRQAPPIYGSWLNALKMASALFYRITPGESIRRYYVRLFSRL
ncbi:histidine kinase [Salmonella enterica subsp. diarizonae]|uniref:histidine kinase n=1 Tax=Salmonella diarizonae TaxID=59204 RepID=A0A379TZA4_SALDZ|nr:histidine kinase [Salmonella enterica subsp. diarizonae]